MNASDIIGLEPLPALDDLLRCHDAFREEARELTAPFTPIVNTKEAIGSPTGVHTTPEIFPPLHLGKVAETCNKDPSFASIIKNNSQLKTSLISVLAASRSVASPISNPTKGTLTRKYPDRSCITACPRSSRKPSAPSTPTAPKTRRSLHDLRSSVTHSPSSVRKSRSASCSKLPRRKSSPRDVSPSAKRPGELADQALAIGAPLSKESARAIRNREHALASRLRAKLKRENVLVDNAALKNKVRGLEKENLHLIRVRDALRQQQESNVGRVLSGFMIHDT